MKRAASADQARIEAFLRDRAVTSMFPLSNLRQHGLDGIHDRSMSFWIAESDGRLTDVVGVTRAGMVMPSCDGAPWRAVAHALHGREVIGVIGPQSQARPLIDALGLSDVATDLNADDPQFVLDLADLVVPDGDGWLMPLRDVERQILVEWRLGFLQEAMSMDASKAEAQAAHDVAGYDAADTHRVLVGPDGPIALTGFNAQIDEIVQVGGVYTPPRFRGRGYARRAVALHLAERREAGVERATLFASGEPAVRAYRAIGFFYVGEWTLFLTAEKERIGG